MTRRRLAIGGHLDRYVGGLFLSSLVTSLLVVVGLFFIMDMASNLDDFLEPWNEQGDGAPATVVLRYYLLNLPFLILQSAPFVTLTAGLFTVSRLLKHNEVGAVLAAGVSARRLLAPVFLGATGIAAAMFGLREWTAGYVLHQRDAALYVLEHHTWDRVYKNLRVRDVDGSVLRFGEFRPAVGDPPIAEGREVEAVLRDGEGFQSLTAERAVWGRRGDELGWYLEGGSRRTVAGQRVDEQVGWLEDFSVTPDLAMSFLRARNNPLELSFRETLELARRDPDNVVYQTLMQYLLTYPLANVVLLLVGLPLMLRYNRSRGVEGLASGLLLCVFFFATDFVFRNLGLQGEIDPLLASWAPLLFFGSLGVVLYDSMRT